MNANITFHEGELKILGGRVFRGMVGRRFGDHLSLVYFDGGLGSIRAGVIGTFHRSGGGNGIRKLLNQES
jgi:hypothetical protein